MVAACRRFADGTLRMPVRRRELLYKRYYAGQPVARTALVHSGVSFGDLLRACNTQLLGRVQFERDCFVGGIHSVSGIPACVLAVRAARKR